MVSARLTAVNDWGRWCWPYLDRGSPSQKPGHEYPHIPVASVHHDHGGVHEVLCGVQAVCRDRQGSARPAQGWTPAVATYGSFIAPVIIGGQIRIGAPENAMQGFAVFHAQCVVLNWWFCLRCGASIKNS